MGDEINLDNLSREALMAIVKDNQEKLKEMSDNAQKTNREKTDLLEKVKLLNEKIDKHYDFVGIPVDKTKDITEIADQIKAPKEYVDVMKVLLEQKPEAFLNFVYGRASTLMEKLKQMIEDEQIDDDGECLIKGLNELDTEFFSIYTDATKVDEFNFATKLKSANEKFYRHKRMLLKWQEFSVEMYNTMECVYHAFLLARLRINPNTTLASQTPTEQEDKELESLKTQIATLHDRYQRLDEEFKQYKNEKLHEDAEQEKSKTLSNINKVAEKVGSGDESDSEPTEESDEVRLRNKAKKFRR